MILALVYPLVLGRELSVGVRKSEKVAMGHQ
jgi:hypothetical protein